MIKLENLFLFCLKILNFYYFDDCWFYFKIKNLYFIKLMKDYFLIRTKIEVNLNFQTNEFLYQISGGSDGDVDGSYDAGSRVCDGVLRVEVLSSL